MENEQKLRILYVEDDPGLASIYTLRLQAEGFDVVHCDRGDKALQEGRDFKPHLILLDLMMPSMSGFDTLELFRSTQETASAKIIVMSALSAPEHIERAKSLGADEFLIKSQVTIDDTIDTIRKHLGLATTAAPSEDSLAPSQNQ